MAGRRCRSASGIRRAFFTEISFFGPKTDGTVADAAAERAVAAKACLAVRAADLANVAAAVVVERLVTLSKVLAVLSDLGSVARMTSRAAEISASEEWVGSALCCPRGRETKETALAVGVLEVESRPAF
jgi:hypothetical protein